MKLQRDIVVVGASAGGINALKDLVRSLPSDFSGNLFIVLHIPSYTKSKLPEILSRESPLKISHASDEEEVQPGRIYVAPHDHHLILEDGRMLVKNGPKENRFRPSIDALFRSTSYVYRHRVIGIILSGLLDDGTSGLWTIQRFGGTVMVQSPDDAEQPQLPENVLEYVEADYIVPASDMGAILVKLQHEPASGEFNLSEEELKRLEMEVIIATRNNAFEMGVINMGELTPFTCPACHGALVRLVEGNLLRYRCHTGHAYTASALLAEVTEAIENNLWQSIRGMEEMNILLKHIGNQYEELNKSDDAKFFRKRAEEGAKKARIIHDSVLGQKNYSEDLRFQKEGSSLEPEKDDD